jgi:hypothetical protein
LEGEKCQDHDVFATFQYVENTVSAISKHHDFQFNLQLYRSGLVNVTTCTGCHTKNIANLKHHCRHAVIFGFFLISKSSFTITVYMKFFTTLEVDHEVRI